MAGQIPLVPSSLTLPPALDPSASPYPYQACLALQHVERVLEVLRSKESTGGGWTGWGESAVCWWALDPGSPNADGKGTEQALGIVREAWKSWAAEVR